VTVILEPKPKRKRRLPWWLELVLIFVGTILLLVVFKTFFVQLTFIPSGSMQNTLEIGDRVPVNRFVYRFSEPQRGDILVFDARGSLLEDDAEPPPRGPLEEVINEIGRTIGMTPPPETVFIKRVIGVAGDTIKCCDEAGQITVNGTPIDESGHLFPGDAPSSIEFEVTVPEGKLWVLGDHRSDSSDSRYAQTNPGGGFVPVDRALGKAFAVLFPWDQKEMLDTPEWAEQANTQ
jgi:signal peptidase I